MSKTVPVALCGTSLNKELKVIRECWDHMQRLDTPARERVLYWLQGWCRAEQNSSDNDHDF